MITFVLAIEIVKSVQRAKRLGIYLLLLLSSVLKIVRQILESYVSSEFQPIFVVFQVKYRKSHLGSTSHLKRNLKHT